MSTPLFNTDETRWANLVEQIDISAGGIVSKPLLETDSIKQVLFAIDAGQDLSEHTSPFVATVQVLDGQVDFVVSGEDYRLDANDWLIMPANAPHAVKSVKPTRMILTLLKNT